MGAQLQNVPAWHGAAQGAGSAEAWGRKDLGPPSSLLTIDTGSRIQGVSTSALIWWIQVRGRPTSNAVDEGQGWAVRTLGQGWTGLEQPGAPGSGPLAFSPHSVHPQSGRVLFTERGRVAWASEGGGSKESHNSRREAQGPHL